MDIVQLPKSEWSKIKHVLNALTDRDQFSEEEYLTEKEAMELLGYTQRTMWNYVSCGKISPDCYTVGIGGNRFYNKKKLMGLK